MKLYENERCIIIDESGNLGSSGRYFVIACIDTLNYKSLQNTMRYKLGIVKKKYPKLAVLHANEVKAKDAYPAIKYHILECIAEKEVKISYIVADLQHTKPHLLNEKNIFYNFLMKLLLDSLITQTDNNTTINILYDEKTTKVSSANSLKEYLILHFIYEKGLDVHLNIEELNSNAKNAYPVQAADYVANALYGWYEYQDKLYYDRFRSKIKNALKFPQGDFGK